MPPPAMTGCGLPWPHSVAGGCQPDGADHCLSVLLIRGSCRGAVGLPLHVLCPFSSGFISFSLICVRTFHIKVSHFLWCEPHVFSWF